MKPGSRRIPDLSSPAPASEGHEAHPSQTGTNAAILKLLGDDDTSMVHLVMEQLLADSRTAVPRLESLLHDAEANAANASGQAAKELRRALRELRGQERFDTLRQRCGQIETIEEFEDFCWHVALCGNPADPGTTIETARSRLDAWALRVREETPKKASFLSRLEALRTVLAEEGGLRGNADDYYDPKNSFLDRVILSGRGIPISLTAVYVLVGHRAGILVEPIGMPGHFLARIGNLYLDPFHEGLSVDGEALREMVKRSATAADAPEEARHALRALAHPMPFALMARRMIVNLVNIFEERKREGEESLALRWRQVLRWIEAGIDPENAARHTGEGQDTSHGHLDEDGNEIDPDSEDDDEGDML